MRVSTKTTVKEAKNTWCLRYDMIPFQKLSIFWCGKKEKSDTNLNQYSSCMNNSSWYQMTLSLVGTHQLLSSHDPFPYTNRSIGTNSSGSLTICHLLWKISNNLRKKYLCNERNNHKQNYDFTSSKTFEVYIFLSLIFYIANNG